MSSLSWVNLKKASSWVNLKEAYVLLYFGPPSTLSQCFQPEKAAPLWQHTAKQPAWHHSAEGETEESENTGIGLSWDIRVADHHVNHAFRSAPAQLSSWDCIPSWVHGFYYLILFLSTIFFVHRDLRVPENQYVMKSFMCVSIPWTGEIKTKAGVNERNSWSTKIWPTLQPVDWSMEGKKTKTKQDICTL